MTRLLLPMLALATALWLPATAHADPKDDARRHFASGLSAAEDGDYAIALQHFLSAQSAYPHPATLFNIARAYSDLGEAENALQYYRLYQKAAPDKADSVQAEIARLERAKGGSSIDFSAPVGAPTNGELERLAAIALEIEALRETLAQRAQPDEPEPEPEAPKVPGATPRPNDSAQGFLSDAYEKQVVTASRVGQSPLDSPSTISVVSGDDLRLAGSVSLPDALRRVAGMDVMSLASGHQDVSIRGFNRELNNKVLILIDGRSTYLDFIGATLWSTLPVTMDEIERVEVIRGPGSAVYGANAVTGVINIITKTPGETPRTIVRATAGATAFGRGSVMTTGRKGNTSYRIAGGYSQIGKWAQSDAGNEATVSPLSDGDDLGARVLKGSARIDHTIGEKGYVSAQAGISQVDTIDYVNIGALGAYTGDDLRHHYLRADAGYDVLHFRAFWNHDQGITGPERTSLGARSLTGRFQTDTVDLEVEAPIAFETGPIKHVLNVGLGYRRLDIRFDYLDGGFERPYAQNHVRGFINEELTYGKLKAVGSLRIDKHPLLDIEQTISPRVALIHRLFEKTSVRATAGTAFRQPTSIESYMNVSIPTGADGAFVKDIGNTGLSPERITTFEVGIHDESSLLYSADAVVFYNRVRDLIFLSDVEPTLSGYDPEQNGYQAGTTGWINLGERYDAFGGEADLELYPVDGLDLFANAGITSIQEVALDGTRTVDQSTSLLKLNAGVTYRSPYRVDATATLHFASGQTWRLREFGPTGQLVVNPSSIRPRTLLSLRLAARPFETHDLEIAIGLWNALGTGAIADRYREHPKGQPLRDVAYGEVSYAF